MSKKTRKPKSKLRKTFDKILGAILLGLVLLLIVIAETVVYSFLATGYLNNPVEDSYELIDISMTKEERLKDFASAYKYGVLSNPNREEFEKLYNINFEEIYKTYQGYVADCDSEAEYYFLLFSFLRTMPSGHTTLTIPDVGKSRDIGFQMSYECYSGKNQDRYTYTWRKTLEDYFSNYDMENTESTCYFYLDGLYVTGYHEDSNESASVLLSINDEDPREYALEQPLYYYSLMYDYHNDYPYRDTIRINDKYGEPVNYKVKLSTGEVIEKQGFIDVKYDWAAEFSYNYGLINKKAKEDTSTEETSEEKEISKPYTIVEDKENNIVYLDLPTCVNSYEMSSLGYDLKNTLENNQNVIIDLRENGGGMATFYDTYLYPYLFYDIKDRTEEIIIENNEYTSMWADTIANKVFYNASKGFDGQIHYCETTENIGLSNNTYNIYVLISERSFSSADIIASKIGEEENVTLIGTSTSGEGMDGYIFNSRLPESYLVMSYSPGKNLSREISNSVYGTAPDIYCPYTVDALIKKYELRDQGEDVNDYEVRKKWDNTLIDTIELINSKK